MKLKSAFLLLLSHLTVGAVGVMLGIYLLPILIAPPPPSETQIREVSSVAEYSGEFVRELEDSDAFHWGEGTVAISADFVSFSGALAPGPDYKLYLSPEFIETEVEFNRLKTDMVRVGDVKTFQNFVVAIPDAIDPSQYRAVIVWCESFGEFITAAKYR